MSALYMFRGFGFPNARREEVDRLRVAMVSRVRGLGIGTFCRFLRLWDMLLMVGDIGHPGPTP
jgi:hypothetical protein